jgi:hypothetical protein
MFAKNKFLLLGLLFIVNNSKSNNELVVIHNPTIVVMGIYCTYKIGKSYWDTKYKYQETKKYIEEGNQNNHNDEFHTEMELFSNTYKEKINNNIKTGDDLLKSYICKINNNSNIKKNFNNISKTRSLKEIASEIILFGQVPLWTSFMKLVGIGSMPETIGKNLFEYNEGGITSARDNLISAGSFLALCAFFPYLLIFINPGLFFSLVSIDLLKKYISQSISIPKKYHNGILGYLINFYQPKKVM